MDKSKVIDDIAVIGMGCRVSGADNINEFWRVLVNGENHITDIPKERWNNDAFYSENRDEPGKSYVKKAGFINEYDKWDNKLYHISDSEATRIDPQQRQVLDCTHMALEDAGITRKQLKGTQTSVFIGAMNDDYKNLIYSEHIEDTNDSATGMSTTLIAARVSYVYDLRGPCMVVDTACSSSMAAIHLGCQAIRSGECDMAICGGVSCMLTPDQFITLCKAKMLSPSGQCQSFCDTADGYGRGEGCGIVLLKSHKKALQEKNKIWGIVKTGGNQDGQVAKPITAPSSEQQEELLKKVYSLYNIDPLRLQYIEAHGTGTPIGDRREINAIGRFIQSHRLKISNGQQNETSYPHGNVGNESELHNLQHSFDIQNERNTLAQSKSKCTILIGSVKSNIGHLESAAGVAALIKVLLMMNNRKFVPSLHVKKDKSNINKTITLESAGLEICTEVSEWKPDIYGNRVCCVNCFGFGGSNMHAVVIQQALTESSHKVAVDNQYKVVCISGLNKAGLKSQMQALNTDLAAAEYDTQDISFTSVFHRDHFRFKTFVFGKTTQELQEHLKQKLSNIDEIPTEQEQKVRIIFVFCGVGSTWKGMCREMMQQTVFRKTIQEIDVILQPLTKWSIAEKFLNDTEYNDPYLSHIALFCMQVALFEQWGSWGIKPEAIIGQSVGEVAAAYASGALSLKDAVQVVHVRSEILSRFTGGKMMVAQGINVSTLEKLCQKYKDRANIAVYNSPVSCTVSGEANAIKELTMELQGMNEIRNLKIQSTPLPVPCAYHSHYVEEAAKLIEHEIIIKETGIRTTDHFSTVTGKPVRKDELQTGKYWADNIRKPVLFKEAVFQSSDEYTYNVFIEIGPKQVLRAHLLTILAATKKGICLPSMNSKRECVSMYTSLNTLFGLGVDIAWRNIVSFDGNIVRVPRYIFQNEKMLHIPKEKKFLLKGTKQIIGSHLYTQQNLACETQFLVLLDKKTTPFVFDHYMSKEVLVPGSTYVEAAFEIGRQISQLNVFEISVSIEFINTYMPRHNEQCRIDADVKDQGLNSYHFLIKNDKKVLCQGNICPRTENERQHIDIQAIKMQCKKHRTKDETYCCLENLDFSYGESLRIIEQSWSSSVECIVEFTLPESVLVQRKLTHMHPSIIDGMFQTFGILSTTDCDTRDSDRQILPKGLASMVINNYPEKHMFGYSYLEESTTTENHFNFLLLSKGGHVLAEIRNFYTKEMTDGSAMASNIMYKSVWRTLPSPSEIAEKGSGNNMQLKIFGSKRFISCFEEFQEQGSELIQIENGGLRKSTLTNVSTFHSIVYAPSFHIRNVETDGVSLYNCVKESFLNLSLLIRTLSDTNKDLPVFIVTENVTSPLLDHGSERNVCGSELWGMARSSIIEGAYSNITLVDMTLSKDNIVALKKILERKPKHYNEFMIEDGKYYYMEIIEVDSGDIPFRREINTDISEDMILKSPSATLFTDLYYDAKTTEFTSGNKSHQCQIQLKMICLHNPSIFPITYPEENDGSIYRVKKNKQQTVMCIEGTGNVHNGTAEMAFCYPVYVTPIASVPEECVCDLTYLSAYVPGMLTVGVILWNIVETCTTLSSETVSIIVDDESDIWIKLIKTILSYQSLSARIESKRQMLKLSPNGHIDTVIVLADLSFHQFDKIEKQFPNVRRIVSIEEYVSKRQKIYMKIESKMILLTILKVDDMFTYPELLEKVPKIYNAFAALEKVPLYLFEKNPLLEDNRVPTKNILDLPYAVLPLYKENGKPNMSLKVTKENVLWTSGCYILVGGLGGLGWELLQLMAKLGVQYIATLSRSRPNKTKIKKIKQIKKKYGCHILNLQGDITDQCQVTEAFEKLRRLLGSHVDIRGIFHGAGVIRDKVLEDISEKDLDEVLLPKVLGTWNLHEATMNLPLDFFVMHSSIVSIFGNQKQSNYAAGNSFQDSFAHYRRSLGLCGQSINWGPLPFGLTKGDKELETYLMNQGFQFLTKEEIYDSFIRALMANEQQLVFGKFDWIKVQQQKTFTMNSNKFADILKMYCTPEMEREESDATRFMYDLFRQDPIKRREMIHDLVQSRIAQSFVVDKSELTESTKIMKLGIDSMSAMNFTNYIYHMTKVNIPLGTIYKASTTLETLTSFIFEQLLKEEDDLEAKKEQPAPCEYLEGHISFMQKSILDDFDKDRYSGNIMKQVDVEISGLQLKKSDLDIVFNHLIRTNQDLRCSFAWKDGAYHAIVHSSRETSINIEYVDFNSICGTYSIDKRNKVRMDITREIPIRVIAAIQGTKTRIRVFIHSIIGDLSGITNLFRCIRDILTRHLQQEALPINETNVDVTEALRETIVPQIDKLRMFWRACFRKDVFPFTFAVDINTELEEAYWDNISTRIAANRYDRMMNFINSQGFSLYNFLISVYMVLLHECTGKPLIPLVTWVDMRAYVTQLRPIIQCCSNAIPVVGDLREMGLVIKYLKRSSNALYEITQHSAYPYELIEREMKSEELKKHISRHWFIMENMTNLNNDFRYENDDFELKIGRPFYKRHTYETSLHIEYDTRQNIVDLQFGYNRKFVEEKFAKHVLPRMLQLIEKMVQSPHQEVQSLLECYEGLLDGSDSIGSISATETGRISATETGSISTTVTGSTRETGSISATETGSISKTGNISATEARSISTTETGSINTTETTSTLE